MYCCSHRDIAESTNNAFNLITSGPSAQNLASFGLPKKMPMASSTQSVSLSYGCSISSSHWLLFPCPFHPRLHANVISEPSAVGSESWSEQKCVILFLLLHSSSVINLGSRRIVDEVNIPGCWCVRQDLEISFCGKSDFMKSVQS